jgi:hypothetical protein
MIKVGFEPTIPVFGRAKTDHVFRQRAFVIGRCHHSQNNIRALSKRLPVYFWLRK